jgi:hypothetical protein
MWARWIRLTNWNRKAGAKRILAEALNAEQPIRDRLQTVLLQSRLAEAEVRDWLKKEHG